MAAIDTRHRIETPEGIVLELSLAGLAPRALAWLFDGMVKLGILILGGIVVAFLGNTGRGLQLLLTFLVTWLYPVLFEVLRDGATPGKKVLGIAVLQVDGTPVGWGSSLVRNLLRVVDFLPLCYGSGAIAVLATSKLQRLGDLAADTIVVHRRSSRPAQLVNPRSAIAPPRIFSLDEERTIVELARRSPGLNPHRAAELAEILSPVHGLKGAAALAHVEAWASWLEGRR